MRSRILTLALACLLIAARADGQGFEFGPRLAVSTPTSDFDNSADLGFDAGMTASWMYKPTSGFGVDVGYQRWPGSTALNSVLDALWSFTGTPVTGTRVTFSAIQATMHVKAVAQVRGPVVPWIQVGAGIYRLTQEIDVPLAQMQAAGWEVRESDSKGGSNEFGYTGSAGLDFGTIGGMRLGLDASYHYLQSNGDFGENLSALTIGTHLLFGSR